MSEIFAIQEGAARARSCLKGLLAMAGNSFGNGMDAPEFAECCEGICAAALDMLGGILDACDRLEVAERKTA